jgi:hypothetical protein
MKKMRPYPLAQAGKPSEGRCIDMAGKSFDGIAPFDDTFYDSLARMVEEPVLSRDLVAMAQLSALGIEKDKEFKPDAATQKILKQAVMEAHVGSMASAMNVHPYWSVSQWGFHFVNAAKTGVSFQLPGQYCVDERALTYYLAFASAKNLGAATFYLASAAPTQNAAQC